MRAETLRQLSIDAEYYIRNLLIPPLSRIFNLVGADVENWYDSMPRTKRAGKYDFRPGAGGKVRIDSHFKSSHCVVCGLESASGESCPLHRSICSNTRRDVLIGAEVCSDCSSDPSRTSHALLSRDHIAQSRVSALHQICASCSSTPVQEPILCDSIDCPITYARVQATRDAEDLRGVHGVLAQVNEGDEERVGGRKPFWQALEW